MPATKTPRRQTAAKKPAGRSATAAKKPARSSASATAGKPARGSAASAKKPARRPAATPAARARAEADDRQLDRLLQTVEAAQKDLASIGGSVGVGVRDLRRDATKLLRDARRDMLKMRRAIQRDLARLQRDLGAVAPAKPAVRGRR